MASETFFTQANTNFPNPTVDGEIDLNGFLSASSHLAKFFGILGTVFYPVESDISGNIQKLENFVDSHEKGKITYVNDIVLLEAKVANSVAIDALLWLKRALEFTLLFLEGMIEESSAAVISEDLRPLCTKAYEETLKNYHGWMVQQIFYLVSRACPYRKDLLASLALNKTGMEVVVLEQMEKVLVNLKKNIAIINHLYETHNLNCTDKV